MVMAVLMVFMSTTKCRLLGVDKTSCRKEVSIVVTILLLVYHSYYMKYFLAVDGGGTKTEVVCADEMGNIVGEGISGPTNITTTTVGASSFNLIEAVRQATEKIDDLEHAEFVSLVMGLAGLDSKKEYDQAYEIFVRALGFYSIENFTLINDSIVALENGSEKKNRVILISGTGSICYGENKEGKTARVSGMDFLLADQGSGYAIGRQVLREAVKSSDGRIKKSILEDLVKQHFKVGSMLEIKTHVYNPLLSKIEVGNLAPLCSLAYEQGDSVAKNIFDKTVKDIILMLDTVIKQLGLESSEFDCVFSGSVIKLPVIKEQVQQALQTKYTNINVITPQEKPVLGALKLAMKKD